MNALLFTVLIATPPSVPLVLGGHTPKELDRQRLEDALATYVTGAQVTLEPSNKTSEDDLCAAAQARLGNAKAAMWGRWQGAELYVAMVVSQAPCPTSQSVGVEVRAPFFYRVAALKLASLLREVQLEEPAPIAVAPTPAPQPVLTPEAPPPAPEARWRIGAGASLVNGDVPIVPELIVQRGDDDLAFGGRLLVGIPQHETSARGEGSVAKAGASATVRLRFVDVAPLAISSELNAGAVVVWAKGLPNVGDDVTRSYVVPQLDVAVLATWTFTETLALELGPALDVVTRRLEITMGDATLYESSWVTVRGVARLTARF